MTQTLDLKALEKKAFRSTFEDGLWDIFIGLIFLQFAVAPLLNGLGLGDFWSSFIFLPVYLIVMVLLWMAKKRIILPRIGFFKASTERKTKMKRMNIILFIIMMIGFIVGVVIFITNIRPVHWIFPGVFTTIVFLNFGMGGYYLDVQRFYAYGLLNGLAIPVGEILYRKAGASHHGFPIVFGMTSGIMIVTGILLFMRFMRSHPPARGGADEKA
ncbi:MAG: hypothetical protein ABIL68_07160 [bacterium]